MIALQKAKEIMISASISTTTEKIAIDDAFHRIIAEDALADMNMPPFDKSAMDGYACRKEDINHPMEVIELIPAGQEPEKRIGPKQCTKIMTGAMVPKGANCVIMVEHTQEENGKILFTKENTKLNICYQGEDIKIGDLLIKKGEMITPHHMAVLASVGYHGVEVYKRPNIAFAATGSELVEPKEKPSPSKIRNSNSYQLMGQLEQMNCSFQYLGILSDDIHQLKRTIEVSAQDYEVLILTGGVSKGDFDLIPDILQNAGYEVLFKEVAIKPGKPVVFAQKGNKYCIGLSGNPVSSYFQFELLAKPFLYHLMGHQYTAPETELELAQEIVLKKADRDQVIPVFHDNGRVHTIDFHGSAHIAGLLKSNGYIIVPTGTKHIKKGAKVHVRSI